MHVVPSDTFTVLDAVSVVTAAFDTSPPFSAKYSIIFFAALSAVSACAPPPATFT